MRRSSKLAAAALLGVLVVGVGCSPTSSPPAYATVTVGPVTYRVELARTADQQRRGLGGRAALPAGTGMLFQFGSRGDQQVWMAGMTFPVDIVWIADDTVVGRETLAICGEVDESACPRWASPGPVDALLEVPAGSLRSVTLGTPVTVEEQP